MSSSQKTLAALLTRAHYLLTENFLEPPGMEGLTATEARLLVALAEEDGVGPAGLARSTRFKIATVRKALDRMEDAKLVRRQRRGTCDHDRRLVLVRLTPAAGAAPRSWCETPADSRGE
jgi:DNA-binding MarR family transcriptional regulator